MERSVEVDLEVRPPLERVREVLVRTPEATFAPEGSGRPTPRSFVVPLAVALPSGAGASHDVVLEVGVPEVEADGARWPIHWRPVAHARVLPELEGELRARRSGTGTALVLRGTYQPPLGRVGALGDDVVGHRVAQVTAATLLGDIATRVERRLAEEARRAEVRPAAYPPDLRDPLDGRAGRPS